MAEFGKLARRRRVDASDLQDASDMEDDFSSFYHREYRNMLALSFVLSGRRSVAEDVVQDAFLALLRDWERVRSMDDPRAWLRRVVSNRSASQFRRVVAERRFASRLRPDPTWQESGVEEGMDVWSAVRRLPRRQAQAVALRYVLDLSRAEVARAMDCSEETAKTHLDRARLALQRELEHRGADDDN